MEMVDVVDEHDRPVGRASLRSCLKGGLLHRAVAVIVVRPGGGILLQQRNKEDPWQSGRWTLSCTGHVKSGETYIHAARRELSEELGLRSRFRRISKLLLPKVTSRGMTEREWVALFISETEMRAKFNPVELEDVREYDVTGLRAMLAGRRLTPDARILLAEYLRLSGDYPGPG